MNHSPPSVTEPITRYDTDRSARTANSQLSIKYPDERVVLIPPHPDWKDITLGNLKNIDGPAMAKLVSDQGLTPAEGSPDSEMARVSNLNMILRHLGVSCARPHPSTLNLELTDGEPVLGPIPGYSLMERDPPHFGFEEGRSLVGPLEVLLYVFLAHLTLFVYSSVVL